MNTAVQRNLWRIPADSCLVVGVTPGGLLAADLLALYLNLPHANIDCLLNEGSLASGSQHLRTVRHRSSLEQGGRILIVYDFVSEYAETFNVRDRLQLLRDKWATTDLSIYSFSEDAGRVDIVFETLNEPAAFEWSLFHSTVLASTCLDIDGVLCVDPTSGENDDGVKYAEFVAEARPLMVPTTPAATLVTSRLERYRAATETWLAAQGITYNRLVMMEYATADDRRRANRQAYFKAKAYLESGALLFVESSPGLALHIAQLAGKPVLAYGTGEVAMPSLRGRVQVRVQRLRWHLRRVRRIPRRLAKVLRSRAPSSGIG